MNAYLCVPAAVPRIEAARPAAWERRAARCQHKRHRETDTTRAWFMCNMFMCNMFIKSPRVHV